MTDRGCVARCRDGGYTCGVVVGASSDGVVGRTSGKRATTDIGVLNASNRIKRDREAIARDGGDRYRIARGAITSRTRVLDLTAQAIGVEADDIN